MVRFWTAAVLAQMSLQVLNCNEFVYGSSHYEKRLCEFGLKYIVPCSLNKEIIVTVCVYDALNIYRKLHLNILKSNTQIKKCHMRYWHLHFDCNRVNYSIYLCAWLKEF